MFFKQVLKRCCAQVAVITMFACVVFSAEPKTVFRIGEFNASSGEFHSHDLDYASPASDIVFEVGKNADKDWPRFQPGPANGMTGGRLHPFTIDFNLPDPPAVGTYYLKIAILFETPRLSHLKLDINGHSGLFYFHPKLDYAAGDWEGTFVPQTSIDSKTIAIPSTWMKSGKNCMVLTALDDPSEAQGSLGSIAPGHTGLIYDAIELNTADGRFNPSHAEVKVEPTIFYRWRAGKLEEVVDVFASAASKMRTVSLIVGQTRIEKNLDSALDFGEQRVEFEVPEWKGKTDAKISIQTSTGGHNFPVELNAAKKWSVLVIPNEHLDIGFTDYPAKVAELHSQSIDDAMDIMRARPEFRWTLDGSWVAEQYLEGRSPEAQKRFLDCVRRGAIVIPPEFANQHTGNASLEGLIRSLYDGARLSRTLALPQALAAQNVDVPSYTWSLPSILHDAGIKYFVGASNSWRAPVMLLGKWNEKSPFYWEGPDGGRVLMWYSRAYLQMHTLFGSPWKMESVRDSLPVYLQAYTRPDYAANSVIIFGTQLENTPLAREQADLPSAWNAQYAYPRIEFSTVQSAMQKIEKEADGKFPVFRGDFGPYWEDGYGSDAAHTAIHRQNQERILTAEKMSVLPSLLSPMLRPASDDLNRAWKNELLFDEHTWTYAGATAQPEHQQSEDQLALKRSRVVEAHREIDETIQRSWAQLSSMLAPKQNSVAVFNSLNWTRSDLVELDLSEGVEIFDNTTQQVVPYEVLFEGKGIHLPGFGGGYMRVRFEAETLPALGYKLYSLRPAITPAKMEIAAKADVVENAFYRLTLDLESGAIKSIFDKELAKELVDQNSPYRFGSFIYVTGGDDIPNNSLYRFGAGLKPPKLEVHPTLNGKLLEVRKTPFATVFVLTSAGENTPAVRTEITLFNREKKIDLRYDFHKERDLHRESAYIAFPIKIAKASFTYGNQTGFVNPAKDELQGGSREWYVARHWTSVSDANVSVTITPLDAPLVTFGDVVRGNWPAEFNPKTATVFSWLLNNYWGTNFPAWQGGNFTFRYSMTSGKTFDPTEKERFGANAMTPLEMTSVSASVSKSILPVNQATLVQIDAPNVTLSTWKIAGDGDGSILRLQETGGAASTVGVRSDYLTFSNAWIASSLEENRSEVLTTNGQFEVSIRPFQTLTVRVRSLPKVIKDRGAAVIDTHVFSEED